MDEPSEGFEGASARIARKIRDDTAHLVLQSEQGLQQAWFAGYQAALDEIRNKK